MAKTKEHRLAVALANYGTYATYIDDDEGLRYMTISFETRSGKLSDWAWYVRTPEGELGPFDTRVDAATKAMKVGWIPKSFLEGTA